jgi:hypothetical protein
MSSCPKLYEYVSYKTEPLQNTLLNQTFGVNFHANLISNYKIRLNRAICSNIRWFRVYHKVSKNFPNFFCPLGRLPTLIKRGLPMPNPTFVFFTNTDERAHAVTKKNFLKILRYKTSSIL